MTDATTCYICYEEASDAHPFLSNPVCACKGSLALHRICYEQVRQIVTATMCSICKQPYNDPEMYVEFDETNKDGYRYVGRRHKLTKQLDGPYTIYHSNGIHWITTQYRNGAQNGAHYEYYENGQLEREYVNKDGEIHGLYKQYYEDGSIYVEATYIGDEYHGSYKEYYRNGVLAYDTSYTEGFKCGDAVVYYETGIKKRVTTYDTIGAILQKIVHYYESGNIECMYIYSENEEIAYKIEYYDAADAKASEERYTDGKCIYLARWRENGELYR